jgi:hypothetical protein
LRHFRTRYEQGDPRPLAAVAGLAVIFVLVFNWLLCRQTFGQYYLQVVPLLALLAAPGLRWLTRRPMPLFGKVVLGLIIFYLAILNPVMNSLTPWTPDLEEKLAIARWLGQEVEDKVIWEPWVYFSYLAQKQFTFYYPFLSIHSARDDPDLPTISNDERVPLRKYLDEQGIQWVVVHDPLLPGLSAQLARIFTGSADDWQIARSFRVTRYASESGGQMSLWTPWWKPVTYYENVTVWRRHPRLRQGGVIGELTIHNPSGRHFVFLEVLHPGGEDRYSLDQDSRAGRQYHLWWHLTGHAVFLGGNYLLLSHQSEPQHTDQLVMTVGFSDSPDIENPDIYQVRLPADSSGRYCLECADTWQCRNWSADADNCQRSDISATVQLTGTLYEPLPGRVIDATAGD